MLIQFLPPVFCNSFQVKPPLIVFHLNFNRTSRRRRRSGAEAPFVPSLHIAVRGDTGWTIRKSVSHNRHTRAKKAIYGQRRGRMWRSAIEQGRTTCKCPKVVHLSPYSACDTQDDKSNSKLCHIQTDNSPSVGLRGD
jgi:hypothetical protein